MARNAGPEDRTDPTASPHGNPSDEVRPGDLSDRSGPDPVEPARPPDPAALRVEALSEEGAGTAPSDPSQTEEAEFLRPDEPADALVASGAEPAEEAPPVRFWQTETSPRGEGADESEPEGLATDDVPPGTLRGPADALAAPRMSDSPEPVASGASTSASSAPTRRGGSGSLILGGLIAAALGFGAAWLAQDRFGGARLPADLEERLAALEARPSQNDAEVGALDERIAGLESRLAALEETPPPADAAPVDLEPLREEVAAGLAQAEERAADLEERLAALEARPGTPASRAEAPLGSLATDPGPALRATPSPETADAAEALEPRLAAVESGLAEVREDLSGTGTALEALEDRVESSQASLSGLEDGLGETQARFDGVEARLGEAETRLGTAETRLDDVEATGAAALEEARAAAAALAETRSRAEAAEAEARREAAIVALDSALDAGEPFEAALPALGTGAPEALTRAASEGVASLAALRETFPDAARAGLAAARSEGLLDEGGVTGFLFGQLSVRSTAPREGSDPDAVLSRAEAALARGRLAEALAEVESLPEPVRAAMSDWIAQARARVEAEAALQTLRAAEPPAAPVD